MEEVVRSVARLVGWAAKLTVADVLEPDSVSTDWLGTLHLLTQDKI